ncbi:DnaJ-like protein [Salmonella enterica subsp. enterica]|uniref:DnaJ-like protein n=1 Tax=Salmonella enterica I TaxID=59201 RepID=A0A447PTL9_SALET|nr:DnaJ-like protein [Salmonella enterica subsp. enterica]
MRQFRSVCFGRFDLIRMFLEIQIQAAFADGSLHPNEREVLYVIAEELGISRVQFDQFLRMMQGGAQFWRRLSSTVRRRLAAGAARPDAGRCL